MKECWGSSSNKGTEQSGLGGPLPSFQNFLVPVPTSYTILPFVTIALLMAALTALRDWWNIETQSKGGLRRKETSQELSSLQVSEFQESRLRWFHLRPGSGPPPFPPTPHLQGPGQGSLARRERQPPGQVCRPNFRFCTGRQNDWVGKVYLATRQPHPLQHVG